jgi:hypothetical protein
MDINLFIKGHSYENFDDNKDDGFVLDILISDLNYKGKDIAFITYSSKILYPDNIVILINYNKYNQYIEQNKKKFLGELQKYAHSIDSRIPELIL